MSELNFQARREWEKKARESHRNGREPGAVVVRDDRSRRLLVVRDVAGLEADVLAHVGRMLETDTCTQQYEHMLWRLCSVSVENGLALAGLSKSYYAGD